MKYILIKSLSKLAPAIIILVIFLTSCDSNMVFDSSFTLPANGWNEKSAVEFKDVVVSDTLALYNFYISVRNTDAYRFSNFYLFLTTKLPNGKLGRDTIEIKLAELNGKWLGQGFGHYKDNQILVRKALRFPVSGKYDFLIEHAMRQEVLTGINNVGIRIERL